MPPNAPSHQPIILCRKAWCRAIPTVLLIALAVSSWVLVHGDPQWHVKIYMFQWRVWPGYEPSVPTDYNGTWRIYDEDGSVLQMCEYRDGEKHGLERVWSKAGVPAALNYYQMGELNGASVSWYSDGQLFQQVTYRRGRQDGLFREYDPDGVLVQDVVIRRSRPWSGRVIGTEHEDGRIVINAAHLEEGSVHGRRDRYDTEGTLIGTDWFVAGKMCSEATFRAQSRQSFTYDKPLPVTKKYIDAFIRTARGKKPPKTRAPSSPK